MDDPAGEVEDMNSHCMAVGGVFLLVLFQNLLFFLCLVMCVGPQDTVIVADSPASRVGGKKIHKFVVTKTHIHTIDKVL